MFSSNLLIKINIYADINVCVYVYEYDENACLRIAGHLET